MRWSHSTQAQSTASHCWMTSPKGCTVRPPLTGWQVTSRPHNHSSWDIQNGQISGQHFYNSTHIHPQQGRQVTGQFYDLVALPLETLFLGYQPQSGWMKPMLWRPEYPPLPHVWHDWTPRMPCTHTHPAPVRGLALANKDIWVESNA